MAKPKTHYTCSACAAQFPKWQGQCGDCGAWNTLTEEVVQASVAAAHPRFAGYAATDAAVVARFRRNCWAGAAAVAHGVSGVGPGIGRRYCYGLGGVDWR